MKQTIAIINESSVVSHLELGRMVAACQRQMSEHFAPIWGLDAHLILVAKGQRPDPAHWWLAVLDTSDQAGALGYHDISDAGLPLGKVFAKTDLDNGYSVSVTLSHELLEQRADPEIATLVQDPIRMVFYPYGEVGDPCEADELGYDIDGIRVTDFCTPAYYQTATHSPTGPFDKQGHLTGIIPTLCPGGYTAVFDPQTGWSQLTMRSDLKELYRARPQEGSRRARRRIPPGLRLRSVRLESR